MAHVRAATSDQADRRFLHEMLYEAAAWRPGHPRPAFRAVFSNPRIACYVESWGRAGDYGVIAEAEGGTPIGAAWYRLFPADARGFGFVSPAIPELTIGVSPAARGHGVGTSLLTALIEHARDEALPALSLSVEEDNPAVRLYERFGFERIGGVENAWTMRLDLADIKRQLA
jgi:ribosomal protein S18 acetylase RimI-like enzyme